MALTKPDESILDLTSTGLAINQVQSNLDTAEADLYTEVENKILGSYIVGLEISNGTDSDHDIDIATGFCKDDTYNYLLELTSTGLTKQLDALWEEGTSTGGRVIEPDDPARVPLATYGSEVAFEEATVSYTCVAKLSATKAIAAYTDEGNSSYGTAVILDISGSTITPGTPVPFEEASTTYISIAAISSTQAIVAYRDEGNSNYITSIILDISGSTITPGTPVVVESATALWTSITMLSSSQALLVYNYATTAGKACVLDISGSTITPGTPATYEAGNAQYNSVTTMTSTQGLVVYSDLGDSSRGKTCVLDITGSTVAPGALASISTNASLHFSVKSLSTTKAIVAWYDVTASDSNVCILDVAASVVTSGSEVAIDGTDNLANLSLAKIDSTTAIVAYRNFTDFVGAFATISISGSTPTVETPIIFNNADTEYSSIVMLDDGLALVVYEDTGNSSYGTSILLFDSESPILNTWYYIWLIRKDLDGSIDALFSTSATNPTLPAGYTYKRRIRGAVLTDGSANIYAFRQEDNNFRFALMKLDVSNLAPGTSRNTATFSVPPNMVGVFIFHQRNSGAESAGIMQEITDTDTSPDYGTYLDNIASGGGYDATIEMRLKVDSSSQACYRVEHSGTDVYIYTKGFIDPAQS